MCAVCWPILFWGAMSVLLIAAVFRLLTIARLPVHLRWELAPVPGEKGRTAYGGSHLEEYEWWKKVRKKSPVAPLIYMAKEILFMKGIWRHNRGLWPFTLALHGGIYLLLTMLFFQVICAILLSFEVWPRLTDVGLAVVSVIAACSYLAGTAGCISLMGKRLFDPDYSWSNSAGTFAHLILLAAVFISGGLAWLTSPNVTVETSLFIRKVAIFDTPVITGALAVHLTLTLLFLAYLPFTNMFHFVAKYFLYHGVRWNDEPRDESMERKVGHLLGLHVGWAAVHGGRSEGKTWRELATEENDGEKTGS
jgi:nitrate reductase gamma subunit